MSRIEKRRTWFKAIACFDLVTALVAITYPALYAELIYPTLTPAGIILAIELLGWWRMGRATGALLILNKSRLEIVAWLWLVSTPLNSAGLFILSPINLVTLSWHSIHLLISAYMLIVLRSLSLNMKTDYRSI